MTWEELKEYLKGKVFLIGLTFINNKNEIIEQYQTHGIVSELSDNGLIKFKRDSTDVFQMPFDSKSIKEAPRGEYTEKTTGKMVQNPDFLMTWEIITTVNDDIEDIKKYGYLPSK